MEKDVQEFIDLLFTPLPTKDAQEFIKLCREELLEALGDCSNLKEEPGNAASEHEFDQVYSGAVKLSGVQRQRLIASLVNYEVLLRRYGKDSAEQYGTPEGSFSRVSKMHDHNP